MPISIKQKTIDEPCTFAHQRAFAQPPPSDRTSPIAGAAAQAMEPAAGAAGCTAQSAACAPDPAVPPIHAGACSAMPEACVAASAASGQGAVAWGTQVAGGQPHAVACARMSGAWAI